MNRKIISVFTLLAFSIFSISCYITSMRKVRTEADWKGKRGEIFRVIKTSGERIEFSKSNPGLIQWDKIVGTAIIMSKEVVIERADIIATKKDRKGDIYSITSKEGKIYDIITGTLREEEDKFIFLITYETSESVSIPLSEVSSLMVRQKDRRLTILAILAGGGAVALGIAAAVLAIIFAEH